MQSKKLLATLIVALMLLLLVGCGVHQSEATNAPDVGASNVGTSAIKNSNSTKSTTEPSDNYSEQSRFIFENTSAVSPVDTEYYSFFDYSFIMTDSETGKQYLYLYHDNGKDGGPVVVELGTTVDVTN